MDLSDSAVPIREYLKLLGQQQAESIRLAKAEALLREVEMMWAFECEPRYTSIANRVDAFFLEGKWPSRNR